MADHGGNLAATPATHSGPCPSSEALLAFCSGSLADGDLVTIADHLSQCETCDQAVRGLSSAGDGLSSRLRQALEQPQGVEEAALLRMQAAAKALLAGRQDPATAETSLDPESEASAVARQAAIHPRSVAAATEMWLAPMPAKIGRYAIKSELGRGGFGSVFLAHDPDLDRLVAIKVPKFAAGVTDEKIKWFLQEARTAAQLKHPGIVAIYEVGRSSDGSCYIVMEHVEGRSLSEELAKGKPSLERTVQIVAQAAAAIHYAHKKGFVHRDLKPANILLDGDGQVKIADFGLAIHEDQQRSRAGERAGTLAYMSPEQIRGDVHRLDGRTDVWSLGVILYELLTGRRPFAGTPREIADEVLHRPPKPPRQIDDHISAHLEQVCLKCLAKEADARYSSAGDVAEALATARQPLARRPSRSLSLLAATTAIVLIVGAAAIYLDRAWRTSRRHPYQVDKAAKLLVPLELMDAPPEELFPGGDPKSRVLYHPVRRDITMVSPTMNLVSLGETDCKWFKLRAFISKPAAGGVVGLVLGYQPLPPLQGKRRWRCQTIGVNSVMADATKMHFDVVRTSYEIRENSTGSFSAGPRRNLVKVPVPITTMDNAMLEVTVEMNRVTEVSWKGMALPQISDAAIAEQGELPACTGRFGIFNETGSCTVSGGQFVLLRELP